MKAKFFFRSTVFFKYVLVAIIIFLTNQVSAQFSLISESEEFKEPGDGELKLMLLKNGSTALIHVDPSDELTITAYDANHRLIGDAEHVLTKNLRKKARFVSALELSNMLSIFISDSEGDSTVLTRYDYDILKSIVVSSQKIASAKGRYWLYFPFSISKSPDSDNYVLCNTDKDEVVWFSNSHEIIEKQSTDFEGVEYFPESIVMGDNNSVYLIVTKSENKLTSKFLAELKLGKPPVFHALVKNISGFVFNDQLVFNTKSRQVIFGGIIETHGKKETLISSDCGFFDVAKKEIFGIDAYPFPPETDSLNRAGFGHWSTYQGLFRELAVNNDSSFTVIFEEVDQAYAPGGSDANPKKLARTGSLLVVTYNSAGRVIGNVIIPKSTYYKKAGPDDVFEFNRMKACELSKDRPVRMFSFVNKPGGGYIVINDTERNLSPKRKRMVEIQDIGAVNPFYFSTLGKDILPEEKVMFTDIKGYKPLFVGIYDYDTSTNTYVTLRSNGKGKLSVIWLQPK